MNMACEICQKRIEGGQDAIKIEAGEARSRWWRQLLGYFRTNPSRNYGVAVAHVECVKVEHDADYPEKTAYKAIKELEE